jgi:thiol-disulfide isomerase/thioredoxin
MRVFVAFRSGEGESPATLKAAEAFIKLAPKDDRGAQILQALASQLDDSAKQMEMYKRIIKDYPKSSTAKMVEGNLRRLDSIGKPFELEFTDAIKGTEVSMKTLKGKVVVIDFWATWCGPCVAEMPNMKKLYAEYKDKGVEFVGVSLDKSKEQGGLDKLKQFVAQNEIGWPQYYQGDYWQSKFSSSWGINSIPAVFAVDADGKLYSVEARGKLDKMIPELLKKAKAGSNTGAGAGGQE